MINSLESPQKHEINLSLPLSTLGLLAISLCAFSRKSRQAILRRDGGRCVICGARDHLEAAHINHNKKNPNYDNPSNGRTLCTKGHLKDHIRREGRNGLSKKANRWAIRKLRERSNY